MKNNNSVLFQLDETLSLLLFFWARAASYISRNDEFARDDLYADKNLKVDRASQAALVIGRHTMLQLNVYSVPVQARSTFSHSYSETVTRTHYSYEQTVRLGCPCDSCHKWLTDTLCICATHTTTIKWQCAHDGYWHTMVLWLTIVDQSVVGCEALPRGMPRLHPVLRRGGGGGASLTPASWKHLQFQNSTWLQLDSTYIVSNFDYEKKR